MKRISTNDGMETPLSLTFLVISIAVISSGASLLIKEGSEHSPAGLRTMQAADMADCMINQISNRHPFLLADLDSFNDTVIIWTGDEIIRSGEDIQFVATIIDVISFTPDNLWSMVVLYTGAGPDITISGSVLSVMGRIGSELFIRVILPIERSPAPGLEVLP
jgi:hypothetical protein